MQVHEASFSSLSRPRKVSWGGSLSYGGTLLLGAELPARARLACVECLAERRHSCSVVWLHPSRAKAATNPTANFTLTNSTNLIAKFNAAAGSWIRNFDCVLKRNSAHLSPSSSSVPLENYL